MRKLGPGLLIWSCLAGNLLAQTRALVASPASLRARMSDSSEPVHLLKGGERVELGLSLATDEGCWTAVRVDALSGYLRCDQIRRETPPVASAGTQPDPQRAAVIDTLLELSGARRQIAQFSDPRQFQSLLSGVGTAEQAQQLQRIFARAFRPEAFYRPLRARLEQNLTPARTPMLLQWLSSPLSRRVVDLEIKASSPHMRGELDRFARKIEREGSPQKRLNLVQRLDSALRSSEFRAEMATILIRNVTQAFSSGAQAGSGLALDKLKADLWRTARDGTLLHFLYTYRTLSDEELEEYVRFWESDNGRWFAPILHQGFLDAIQAVTQDLLSKLQHLG
jgi:hypothetical protein